MILTNSVDQERGGSEIEEDNCACNILRTSKGKGERKLRPSA